jgi:hypothetical protein
MKYIFHVKIQLTAWTLAIEGTRQQKGRQKGRQKQQDACKSIDVCHNRDDYTSSNASNSIDASDVFVGAQDS